MTTYTARLRIESAIGFASCEFEAKTPEAALALARVHNPQEICFEPCEHRPVNEIIIYDDEGNALIEWYPDDVRLRLAAHDLLDAAKKVVSRWATGDLAGAVRELDAAITKATGGG
jgi:hypothetical protein